MHKRDPQEMFIRGTRWISHRRLNFVLILKGYIFINWRLSGWIQRSYIHLIEDDRGTVNTCDHLDPFQAEEVQILANQHHQRPTSTTWCKPLRHLQLYNVYIDNRYRAQEHYKYTRWNDIIFNNMMEKTLKKIKTVKNWQNKIPSISI